jgi:chromosome segregation ATPase
MTNNNQDSSGIVIDTQSGISEEEQLKILAQINSIAEKNRLSLSESGQGEGKSRKPRFKAKKSGGRFPVIVNITAIVLLAGGFTILLSMQGKTDARIRTGTKVYDSVERAIIEEIRKETTGLADGELERLNTEQYQSAAVEAQMGAFFANLNSQIADNSLDEAAGTIKSMRDFINTPAFQSLRSIRERKDMYVQAINSFETMVEEARKYRGASIPEQNTEIAMPDLQARIARLEQDIAEKDKTIEAVSSQGTGAARRLNELEKANSDLKTDNGQLGRTNGALQTENGQLRTRNTQLTSDLERQTQSATTLQRDLQTERAETARLNQAVTARDSTISNRNDVITRIRNEVELDSLR